MDRTRIQAVILAAGRGSRLGLATEDKPKCLVKLYGQTLLEWQVSAMRSAGITDISVVVGYLGERIRGNFRRIENPRWNETNMVASMLTYGREVTNPVIVSYSDIVYDRSALLPLMETTAELVILYDANWRHLWEIRFQNPETDAESFQIAGDGSVLAIGGRVQSLEGIQGQFMGLLQIGPGAWSQLVRIVDDLPGEIAARLDTTALLQLALTRGMKITGLPYTGPWAEVDSVSDLHLYESDPQFAALKSALAGSS